MNHHQSARPSYANFMLFDDFFRNLFFNLGL